MRRYATRTRLRRAPQGRSSAVRSARWAEPPIPLPGDVAEVALYPLGPERGTLPLVVVDVPPEGLFARLAAQDGEVAVRGDAVPGHAVVLVFDDGTTVACQYPAQPPPPVGAKRLWAY